MVGMIRSLCFHGHRGNSGCWNNLWVRSEKLCHFILKFTFLSFIPRTTVVLPDFLQQWATCFGLRPRVVQYSQIDSTGVSGDEKGLYWYQWYDWYQWKSILFQWFCWWLCISLRGLRLFSHVVWLGTGQFQWSIGTNGTIGTNGKASYSNGSVGDYASH